MQDLAVAISVYDKFDDVKLIVDVIRHNWKGNFYIAVCSSYQDPWVHLRNYDIDHIMVTDNIPFDPDHYSSMMQAQLHLRLRTWDCIKKSCLSCSTKSTSQFTMHIHADAYPLTWEGISKLLEKTKDLNKVLALRGDGIGFYSPAEPVGAFDDHFFVFDNTFSKKIGLWEFELMDFLPHKICIHGLLAMLAAVKVGLKNTYHYKNNQQLVYWDNQMIHQPPLNSNRPMSFDPEFQFLHLHESDFPDNLGHHLKAHYFHKFDVTAGDFIQHYLKTWLIPEKELMARLYAEEKCILKFFKFRGIVAHFGRDFLSMTREIAKYNSLSAYKKLLWLLSWHLNQLRKLTIRRFREKLHHRTISFLYHDTVWPNSIVQLYENNLRVPESLKLNYLKTIELS